MGGSEGDEVEGEGEGCVMWGVRQRGIGSDGGGYVGGCFVGGQVFIFICLHVNV